MPVSKHKIDSLGVEITAAYLDAFKAASSPLAAEITQEIPMTTSTMEAPMRGFVGPLREWVGPRVIETVSYDRFAFRAKKFEKTIDIPVDDIEDDNVGIYKGDALDLGTQAANWKDQQVFAALEANGVCFDGRPFFDTAHPTAQGNVSNYQAGAGQAWYLFDVRMARKPLIWGDRVKPSITALTNPTDANVFWHDKFVWGVRAKGVATYGMWQLAYKSKAALTEANLEAALIAMGELKNEHGEKLGVKGTLLVVPNALQGDARRLLEREYISGGESNSYKGAVRWVIGDRLTGA